MNNPQTAKPTKKSIKKLAAAVTIIIVIVLGAYSAYSLLANTPSTQSTQDALSITPESWMKKGAYAIYEGQANSLSTKITFEARMEIVGINQTHAQIQTYINMSTPFGSTENTITKWVNLSNMTFQPEGLTLNSTYNTQISTGNIGTRTCTVYEYTSREISATYYVDNIYHWPIKMTITSPVVDGQSYNMDVNLVDSNIPGL